MEIQYRAGIDGVRAFSLLPQPRRRACRLPGKVGVDQRCAPCHGAGTRIVIAGSHRRRRGPGDSLFSPGPRRICSTSPAEDMCRSTDGSSSGPSPGSTGSNVDGNEIQVDLHLALLQLACCIGSEASLHFILRCSVRVGRSRLIGLSPERSLGLSTPSEPQPAVPAPLHGLPCGAPDDSLRRGRRQKLLKRLTNRSRCGAPASSDHR